MECSCNLFGRRITITSPRSLDGVSEGRSNKSKKKWKKGRRSHRGGPMDEDDEDGNVGYRCSPHPSLTPPYELQSMPRSVIYSNGSPTVVMQAPATGYIPAPQMSTSYAYAAPATAPVVLEQQAPAPSKSRVRFTLPGGSGRHNVNEPVVANPVGAPTTGDTYYQQPPQHDHHLIVQQHSGSYHQQIVRHEDTTVAGQATCGTYQTPPPHLLNPAVVPPEYSHYNFSYPTPRREAVYRIGTDANRFSMFSDENPNACAIV